MHTQTYIYHFDNNSTKKQSINSTHCWKKVLKAAGERVICVHKYEVDIVAHKYEVDIVA